jgi:hypothetical protein
MFVLSIFSGKNDVKKQFESSIQGTLVTLTQAGYRFILRFCEHFTCLSSYMQNAIKLENISNLITSPSIDGNYN